MKMKKAKIIEFKKGINSVCTLTYQWQCIQGRYH